MNALGDAAAAAGVGLTVWRRASDGAFQLLELNAEARRLLGPAAGAASLDLPASVRLLLDRAEEGASDPPSAIMLESDDGLGALVIARAQRLTDGTIGLSLQLAGATGASIVSNLDPLTGTAARGQVVDIVTSWLGEWPVSVAMLNLRRFRDVNSTLGHRQGDVLLRLVASRLAAIVGSEGVVGRLGADHFIVACRDPGPEGVAPRLVRSLAAPFVLGGSLPLRVSAAVGEAAAPRDGDTADALLQRADIALGAAKRDGRAWARYDPSADRSHARRLRLLNDLRAAITRGELALHYQPKVDVAHRRLAGAEGLLRWTHAELGPISPVEFVPIAEETGMIAALTKWVLSETGRHWQTLAERGIETCLSANISAGNLYDPNLAKWLSQAMERSEIPAGGLALELTETQMAADLPMAGTVLSHLRATGARLSLDDFGTGYSSLSYLSRLPFDEVKIDRSFVHNLSSDHDRRIINSIIGLGHDLGMAVVAEGVETEGTVAVLTELGCDEMQGHHVSHALPIEEFADWAVGSVG